MNFDSNDARFTQMEVAKAADVAVGRVRNWVARGLLRYADDDKLGARGGNHLLSAHVAVRLALMDSMTQLVSVENAAKAALHFATTGKGKTPASNLERDPGGLYDQGETEIWIPASGKPIVACRFADGTTYPEWVAGPVMVQPVDDIWLRVMHRLERIPTRSAKKAQSETSKEKVDA